MRICYLGDAQSAHMQKWAQYYSSQGHDVLVISSRMASLGRAEVVQLPKARLGKLAYVISLPRVSKIVHSFNPDILHGHYVTSYGGMTGRIGLNPFLLSAWGSDVLDTLPGSGMKSALIRWFDAPALRNARYITVESPALIEPLLRLGVQAENITVIPWGVDVDVFKPGYSEEVARLRSALSISPDSRVVLSMRSTKPVYSTILILEAFAKLRGEISDIILVLLAGTRDTRYYERVLDYIASEGLASAVRIIDYALAPSQMAALINLSDVVVSVPQWDSLSVSVLEAAACCRPLVLSRIPANEELLLSGITADLVELNASQLSAALQQLMLASGVSGLDRNRALIDSQYSWTRSAERMSELYGNIISGKGE